MAESLRSMLDQVVRQRKALAPEMKRLSEKQDLSRSEGNQLDQLLTTHETLTASDARSRTGLASMLTMGMSRALSNRAA